MEADPDSFELFALQTTGTGFRLVELSTADATFGQQTTTGADLTGAASSSGAKTSDPAGNVFYFTATPSMGSNTLYAADTSDAQLDALLDSDVLSGVDTTPEGLEFARPRPELSRPLRLRSSAPLRRGPRRQPRARLS
jgi:hypothetical protein